MHHDAVISCVTVILTDAYNDRMADAIEKLKGAGLSVDAANDDQGIVEGSIAATKAHDLNHLDCVRYVRVVTTYVADYPKGDPRDLDGVDRERDDVR